MQIIHANFWFRQASSTAARSAEPSSKRRNSWLWVTILLVAGFLGTTGTAAGQTSKEKKGSPGDDIFNGTNVIRISIELSRGDYNSLRNSYWGGRGGGGGRPEVKVTVKEGDKVYSDVAMHLKGAAGSFRSIDDQPSFTLNFEKNVPKQSFHGLHKLSLNSSVQDRTLITEKLCREMFEAAGVPVPRADYAVVTLNGRNLGLYVLVEGFNKQFLRRYFENVGGNLYDGGFCQEISGSLSVNSGDNPKDHSELDRLVDAAHATRQKDSLEELGKVLDIDRFLALVAMEVIQCHWDGYSMNRNNYRVYSDQDVGRIILMPHGLDQMFGMSGQSHPQLSLFPRMTGLLANSVLGTTEGRERYMRIVGEQVTNIFNVEKLTNRVREIEARIRPYLKEGRRPSLWDHKSEVNRLCENIEERGRSLLDQLNAPSRSLVFDDNHEAKLEGWRERATTGRASFDKSTGPEGTPLLHIIANRGPTAASWRATVTLKRGWYILQGKGKTKGVARDSESGAGLRISGATTRKYLRGDNDWSPLSFPFQVQDITRDVELVCELKGSRGEVWFDPSSLKLKRLDETRVER